MSGKSNSASRIAKPNSPDKNRAASCRVAWLNRSTGVTPVATPKLFSTPVNGKACVRLRPSADSAATLNLAEAYIFSDRLAELRSVVSGLG